MQQRPGCDGDQRRGQAYTVFIQNVGSCVIFEITSKSTKNEDMINKKDMYASLDVREHFLFDPLRDYLKTSLLGFRLKGGRYAPLPTDSDGYMTSRELGVSLISEGDPRTGRPVPIFDESLAEAEYKRAEMEHRRAKAKAEKLAAKLRSLGIEPE